jgi:hypothetical protein
VILSERSEVTLIHGYLRTTGNKRHFLSLSSALVPLGIPNSASTKKVIGNLEVGGILFRQLSLL